MSKLLRMLPSLGEGLGVGFMLLILVSCKADEDLRPADEPDVLMEKAITFCGSEEESQTVTRAGTPLNLKGVSEFQVWGYKNMSEEAGVYGGLQTVFPQYTVKWQSNSAATTTTNTNDWEYILPSNPTQTIKFWDWSSAAYRFFAVTGDVYCEPNAPNGPYEVTVAADCSPVRAGAGTAMQKIAANIEDTPYFSRLWFSTGVLPEYSDKQFGKPVQLEFLKPFSRVRFIFKYVFPREGIALSNVEFLPTVDVNAKEESRDSVKIARKGTVTISYPLVGTAIKESYSSTVDGDASTRLAYFQEDYDPENDAKDYTETDNGWYTVLPNMTQGSYTLKLKVNNSDRKAVVPQAYMQWLPGYSYTYVFKITEAGGVEIDYVEAAVTNWTEANTEHSVYNW